MISDVFDSRLVAQLRLGAEIEQLSLQIPLAQAQLRQLGIRKSLLKERFESTSRPDMVARLDMKAATIVLSVRA